MAANEREFTLVGKFDDQITKKLKEINAELEKLGKPLKKDNATKSLKDGFEAANKELKTLQDQLAQINKFQMKFDKSGIQAATQEVKVLGKEIEAVSKAGFNFDKSGIVAAQEEANVLGDILKANALVKVGEGFSNALTAGATSAVNILQRGMGFVGNQFKLAVDDQLEDLQARGSLYGALSKSGVFGPQSTEKEMSDNYRLTRSISRANEQAIGEVVRTSSVSTGVVTTLSRQMTDNLLPSLLKARGIASLKGKSRDDMDTLFGGKGGIGTELAGVYEKMATVIPNAGYAKQAAFGFTQAITGGTINRQLAIFENNPVLVDALKTIDGGIAATSDVGKRIVILKKALEIAAPTMMLDEMRNTLAGGLQAVQDTLTNPTVGILSLGADIANEGKKTLEQYKKGGENSAYTIKLNRVKRNIEENADKLIIKGLLDRAERAKYVSDQTKEAEQKLTDALENADSPIEKISVAVAPVLQEFASLLNSFGNLFLGPVTEMMNVLNAPLAHLEKTFAYLTTQVKAGDLSMGEALGRAVGELFKALATFFNPKQAGKVIGDGINTFFDDFMKGFKNEKFDGEAYMKIVLDSLQSIIMKLIFKEGDVMKGMTGLGDALTKVFLLLAAPAFVSALISGLIPIALMGIGGMLKGVFKGLAANVAKQTAGKAAAEAARAAAAANAARTANIASAALGAGGSAGAAGAAGAGGAGAGAVAATGAGVTLAGLATIVLIIAALVAAFVIFEGPLRALSAFLMDAGQKLQQSTNWAQSAFGVLLQGISLLLNGLTDFFTGIWDIVSGMFTGDSDKIIRGVKKLFTGIVKVILGTIESIAGLGGVIIGAIGNLFNAVGKFIQNAMFGLHGQYTPGQPREAQRATVPRPTASSGAPAGYHYIGSGRTRQLVPNGKVGASNGKAKTGAEAFGSANPFIGNLGEAINFEMANKPANSHLVIANSSETVIPAAGGFGGGMQGVIAAIWGAAQMTTSSTARAMDASASVTISHIGRGLDKMTYSTASSLSRGFGQLNRTTASGQSQITQAMNRSLSVTSAQNQQLLSAIKAAAAAGGFGGMGGAMGLGGGYGGGGVRIAGMLGNFMKATGGAPGSIWEHPWHGGVRGRHASGSYHYSGRAIDIGAHAYEQAGVIARVRQFNAKYGVKPVEFLHAGNRSDHQDHVHVAYALGKGRPALFSSQVAAETWERQMIPASMKVRSITTNSGETNFGSTTLHAPITIYQQPNQDAEQLASMVAIRIGMAVDELRNRA